MVLFFAINGGLTLQAGIWAHPAAARQDRAIRSNKF
jgi:hypothetical protein